MHTIIHPNRLTSSELPEPAAPVRPPHFECEDQPQTLKVSVFVPGVDASGIEVSSLGPDLVVLARRTHHVRPNWRALHLEGVQQDYALRLRLGSGFDLDALHAELRDDFLTISVPKTATRLATAGLRRVA